MRLTLTEDGCDYEGAEVVPDGAFTAELNTGACTTGPTRSARSPRARRSPNSRPTPGRSIGGGTRRGASVAHRLTPRRSSGVGVAASDRGLQPADVEPRTDALTCFNDDLPTWRGYVAAQLEVTG